MPERPCHHFLQAVHAMSPLLFQHKQPWLFNLECIDLSLANILLSLPDFQTVLQFESLLPAHHHLQGCLPYPVEGLFPNHQAAKSNDQMTELRSQDIDAFQSLELPLWIKFEVLHAYYLRMNGVHFVALLGTTFYYWLSIAWLNLTPNAGNSTMQKKQSVSHPVICSFIEHWISSVRSR